jgi:serine/threonine protein kinase
MTQSPREKPEPSAADAVLAEAIPASPRTTSQIRSVTEALDSPVTPPVIIEEPPPESSGPVSGRRTHYSIDALIDGKYKLLRPLGAGGMGEVWVAHHQGLDIDVAVKFIAINGQEQDGDLAERLLEEARNTARLGHPGIVRALDFGHTERGDPFIVLELLEGEDLATLLERDGPVPAERAVATLLPIASALSAVHESGIVHRDIKPENVFLARAEHGIQAKLLDFGISRKTDRTQRLTLRDTALGTPDYMSPEQARGETSGASTDQFSFCVVLFETICCTRPFSGDNYNALLRAIIEQEPKTLSELGFAQPELEAILARGLSKDHADRYETMRELGEALARWLIARGVEEDSAGTSLKRAWLPEQSQPGVPFPTESSSRPGVTPAHGLEFASTQIQMPALATRATGASAPATDPHHAVTAALEEALQTPPPGPTSTPDLEALAELHRGGDPEERFQRDSRRRVVLTLALIVVGVLGVTFAILFGTGIIQ